MNKAAQSLPLMNMPGLTREDLIKLAFETGLCRRQSGKIDIPTFFSTFCQQSLQGTVSYNDLAARMETVNGVIVSRQAYHQRMGKPCVDFFTKVLERMLQPVLSPSPSLHHQMVGKFKRILVQDSTIVRLPLKLFPQFSGVRNATTTVCNARIQGIYDLISRQFQAFSIDPYSKNDLDASTEIDVQPYDLIVRDRGYFNMAAVDELKKKGADSLFLYKHGNTLCDPDTGKEFNLLEHLKREGEIDKILLIGKHNQYTIRVMAKRVDATTKELRKLRACKKSSHKNPSPELLELMGWTIYVTTIFDKEITFDLLNQIYNFRWRIEIIFKTWKSYFNFAKIHNVSEAQVKVLLHARLVMITLLQQRIFNNLSREVFEKIGRELSMMKFMRYAIQNIYSLGQYFCKGSVTDKFIDVLKTFCLYDSRKRLNFEQKFRKLLELWDPPPALA